MRQKTLGLLLIVIGVLCLVSVLGLKWYSEYMEHQALLEIEQGVRDSVFLVEHDEYLWDEVQGVSEDDFEDVISAVDQDQEVEEVVNYKNVLDIPKIECQAYIGEGTTAYNLHRGVGHHSSTVEVGEIGNCVIAGHASRTYKCIFNRLEEMQMFDQFYAYDKNGEKHTYHIIRRFVCSPSQTSILDNIDDGRSTITIYTCTEGGTMRFVLVGTEFTEEGLKEFKDSYYGDKISHMRTLNANISVESVSDLLSMRSTVRLYSGQDIVKVILRPWQSNDTMYSDAGALNFGIELMRGGS